MPYPIELDLVGQKGLQSKGTAGGLLKHKTSGQTFITSCAHVFGNKGSSVYSTKKKIAEVVLSTKPPPKQQGANCNKMYTGNSQSVDFSIAELDDNITFSYPFPKHGVAEHWTGIHEMSPYDEVSFIGNISAYTKAEIGALSLWHEIDIEGKPRCFNDIFEITPKRPWYFNTLLAKHGDSGSWILNDENNVLAWDGVLIGGDGAKAYCAFSENIKSVLDDNNFDDLILIK